MQDPDWSLPAELYAGISSFRARNARYLRFPTAAEAVRYAIEDMPDASLRGVSIESGDNRYEGGQIRALYEAADFPLKRVTR
jgi:hypothetical protein